MFHLLHIMNSVYQECHVDFYLLITTDDYDGTNIEMKWYTLERSSINGDNLEYTASYTTLNTTEGPYGLIDHPRLMISLERKPGRYIRETILPTAFFVMASWVNGNKVDDAIAF